jgi:hypothetical protein
MSSPGFHVLRTAAVAAAVLVVSSAQAGEEELGSLASGLSQRTNVQPPGVTDRYGHAEVLVQAPIAAVHEAVLDFARYKNFSPERFHNARVVGREADATDVYMQVPIMNGLVVLWQIMRFRDLRPLAPGWAMVEGWYVRGNLKRGNVAWTLHAIDDQHTVLKVDLLIVPNVPAPQEMIDEELRDAAAQAVESIRDTAQGRPGPVPYGGPR